MNDVEKNLSTKQSRFLFGVLSGLLAAVAYATASAFLRALATDVDPALVSTIKALCTVLIFGPWLCGLAIKRYPVSPSGKCLLVLVGAGVLVQVGGNWVFQISLGTIGMALTVPLVMGSMIVSTVVVGRVVLRERISQQLGIALAILVISIFVLSFGVQQAREAVETAAVQKVETSSNAIVIAVLGACFSGFSFSVLGVAIRWSTKSSLIPLATPMVIVGACGVTLLGTLAVTSIGWEGIEATSSPQWRTMFSAGVCNSIAFLALSHALRVLPVIYVNAINMTQIGLSAILGAAIFGEQITFYLIAGLALMMAGFATMRKQPNVRP